MTIVSLLCPKVLPTMDQKYLGGKNASVLNMYRLFTIIPYTVQHKSHLASIHFVLGTVSNLQRVQDVQEDVHRSYAKYCVVLYKRREHP